MANELQTDNPPASDLRERIMVRRAAGGAAPKSKPSFPAWREKDKPAQLVYFMAAANGPIKIGHAYDPDARLVSVQCGHPAPLAILATVSGGPALERKYHRQFAHLRLHGEWFRRTGEIEHEILRIDPSAMKRIDEWADLAGDKYGCQVCDPFPCRLHIHREAPLWGASHA
jgi:hypothetical protein